MRRSARLRQREVWRQKQTSNSKQRHHTALAIIAGYHTSKMQQTHRESAAAIASKSGRRELEAEGHQKRASAGANSKTKLAMAVGRLAYPEALGPSSKKCTGTGGRRRAPVAPINKWLGSILAVPRVGWGWARESARQGGAAAGQRVARVIGGVSTYHWSATRWGLVVFPRFASVCRTAAAAGGGGGARSAPLCSSVRVTVQKKTPKVQTFLKGPELKLQMEL